MKEDQASLEYQEVMELKARYKIVGMKINAWICCLACLVQFDWKIGLLEIHLRPWRDHLGSKCGEPGGLY